MSRNQKAPLLAFALVALVCCAVLVDSIRGEASDGKESASTRPPSASATPGDEQLPLPPGADDDPSADPPFQMSPPLAGTGGVGPGQVASGPDDSGRGVDSTSSSADEQSDLGPGAGGAPGSDSEQAEVDETSDPGVTEPGDQVDDRGEERPRKAKRRGPGIKDPAAQLPDHLPDPGHLGSGKPDPGQVDPDQGGSPSSSPSGSPSGSPSSDGQPGSGQPGNGQPGNGPPSASPSAANPSPSASSASSAPSVPDLGSLLELPGLTPLG